MKENIKALTSIVLFAIDNPQVIAVTEGHNPNDGVDKIFLISRFSGTSFKERKAFEEGVNRKYMKVLSDFPSFGSQVGVHYTEYRFSDLKQNISEDPHLGNILYP